jgi:hypothetical protein
MRLSKRRDGFTEWLSLSPPSEGTIVYFMFMGVHGVDREKALFGAGVPCVGNLAYLAQPA